MTIKLWSAGAALVALAVLSSCGPRQKANIKPPRKKVQLASTFLSGGWKTDGAHPRAVIAAGLPGKADTLIRIGSSYMADTEAMSHTIVTDRGNSAQRVEEGSYAVAEGRNMELLQSGGGQMAQGTWTAVVQPVNEAGFTEFPFSVRPKGVTQVLDLTTARQFVLTFTGYANTSCPQGDLRVFVDGKPLVYRDKTPVTLINGNSVWSYGKSVYVQLLTACNIPQTGLLQTYSGSVKVLNAAVAPA